MKKIFLHAKKESAAILILLIFQVVIFYFLAFKRMFSPIVFLITEVIIWVGILHLILRISRKFEAKDTLIAELFKNVFKYGLLILIIAIPWISYILMKI